MRLEAVDWAIVAGYLVFSLAAGVVLARRAGSGMESFFLSGRSLPWWLAGTSMAATSFAADTPLAVTEMVRTHGVAGNWLWWSYGIGGMLSVFLFARFWRRARVVTDAEVTELRYSGRGAAALRAWRGFYSAVIRNCLVMGWVILAMATLVEGAFPGVGKGTAVAVSCGVALVYAVLSGFWAVVVTDLVQFVLALTGAGAAAFFAFRKIGGLEGLAAAFPAERLEGLLRPLPVAGESWLPTGAFAIYLGMLWWCTDNADGGGIIIQRMSASRNEKEAVRATLWFQFAHYGIRTWPWVLVALASLVLFPEMTDHKAAYPATAFLVLPAVWRGILAASLMAAFMSTIDTHLNWGASYLINDLYRRFIDPGATDRRLVLLSRVATILLMGLGALAALRYRTITGAWILTISLGAGAGIVYILRWFWWRINAWSELSAMLASLAANAALRVWAPGIAFPYTLPWIVGLSAAVWVPVTFLTAPVEAERLRGFCARVRPLGAWGPFRGDEPRDPAGRWLLQWGIGTIALYAFLFGGGSLLLGSPVRGAVLLGVAAAGGAALFRFAARERWSE
ncbi:MAG: Na+:solute symporter [Candidatus Eisenbacteria bacterium]|nr:Na+:solute symporter [Candidatus Eisenbacteria bacterium]